MAFHQKFVSVVIANLSGEKNGRGIGRTLNTVPNVAAINNLVGCVGIEPTTR